MMAADTARAAGLLEHATSEEMTFTQKQLLSPRRNQGDYGMADSMSPDQITKIVEAFAAHTGSGPLSFPAISSLDVWVLLLLIVSLDA